MGPKGTLASSKENGIEAREVKPIDVAVMAKYCMLSKSDAAPGVGHETPTCHHNVGFEKGANKNYHRD